MYVVSLERVRGGTLGAPPQAVIPGAAAATPIARVTLEAPRIARSFAQAASDDKPLA
jgi:ABC-type enterobactin transport system permease subunit